MKPFQFLSEQLKRSAVESSQNPPLPKLPLSPLVPPERRRLDPKQALMVEAGVSSPLTQRGPARDLEFFGLRIQRVLKLD